MGLRELAAAWWPRRRRAPVVERVPAAQRVFVLNALVDIPSSYPLARWAGEADADPYVLDYNYIDRARARAGVAALLAAHAGGQLDAAHHTLVLNAKGLHPCGGELAALARAFARHHVFFELWNGLREVVELAAARFPDLYFLPVMNRLGQVDGPRVPAHPNRRVFVSLGGDDDLDLIAQVVAAHPQLHFCVPDTCWQKPGSEKVWTDVRLPAANVTAVDCAAIRHAPLGFSPAYRAAYASCDTVLIATRAERMQQMRGGVRLADALYARKHIVVTENPLCQLLMAQHERTCLVAEHDAAAVAAHLDRIAAGAFTPDAALCEPIRRLTVETDRFAWMIDAARRPDEARRSPFAQAEDPVARARRCLFARGRALLEAEVAAVARSAGDA